MSIVSKSYTASVEKIFSSDFEIPSESHLQVLLDGSVVSQSDYDLINNAAVFHAPVTGAITIRVGTTPDDLLTSTTDIETVATNIGDIQTLEDNIDAINTVSDNIVAVQGVNNNNTDVSTVATNIADVNTVAGNTTNINAVSGNTSNINSVEANESNINIVAGIGATGLQGIVDNVNSIDTVAGIYADVTTVANNDANVSTVAGIDSNVSIVAGISADVTAVANNAADISEVASDLTEALSEIETVAADLQEANSEIDIVAGNIVAVNTVGLNISNVNTVSNNISDVSSVASNISDVTSVADNMTEVLAADTNAATATTKAAEALSSANSAATSETNASASATNASTSETNASTSATNAATSATNAATSATNAATSATNAAASEAATADKLPLAGGTMTGDVSLGDNVKAKFGAGDDLQIYHSGTTSWIRDIGTGDLVIDTNGSNISLKGSGPTETMARFFKDGAVQLYHNNSQKLATTSTGIDVTGSVTCDGLTSYTTTANSQLYLTSQDTGQSAVNFGGTTSNAKGSIRYSDNSDWMKIYTNSSERMLIDGSGNVGIGTSSPDYELDVEGVTDPSIRVRSSGTASTDDSLIRLQIAGTTASNIIAFGDSGSSFKGEIRYRHNGDSLAFKTASEEAMRIDSAGNVGIGTTTPNYPLDVAGTIRSEGTAPLFILDDTDGGYSQIEGDGSNLIIAADRGNNVASSRISLTVDNDEKMRIDSAGNVGIGTSSPSTKLHVRASLTNSLIAESTTSKVEFNLRSSSNSAYNAMGSENDEIYFKANNGERLRITSAGNVGIGTTTPEEKLHVEGSLKVDFGSANANPRVYLDHDSATDDGNYLQLNRGDDGLEVVGQNNVKIRTNGSERMRINSSGNVGIGTTSPQKLLDITDSSSGESIPVVISNKDITVGTGQKVTLGFGLARNSGAFKPEAGTIEVGRELDWTSDDAHIDSYMAFSTYLNNAATEKLRITSAGNVGIGTTSPGQNLHVSASTDTRIALENTPNRRYDLISGDSGEFRIWDTAVGERMRITSSGNVGFGHSNPYVKMVLAEDKNSMSYVDLRNDNTGSSAAVNFRAITIDSSGSGTSSLNMAKYKTGKASFSNSDSSGTFSFSTAGLERLIIANSGVVTVVSGKITLDDNPIGGTGFTIADNAVATVTPPRKGGFMFLTHNGADAYPQPNWSGMCYFDCGNSPMLRPTDLSSEIGGDLAFGSGVYTGTTGTDGKVTVSAQANGTLQIENRSGASKNMQCTFL